MGTFDKLSHERLVAYEVATELLRAVLAANAKRVHPNRWLRWQAGSWVF